MTLSNVPPNPPEDAFLHPIDPRALDDARGTLPVPSRHELMRLKLLSDQDTLSEQEIEYADPLAVQRNRPLPPGTAPYPLPDSGIDLSDEISPADFITAGD
jgi:hypothetical protein